ncbi:response regulator transcription factor [Fusibacter sp. JL298sf-3]
MFKILVVEDDKTIAEQIQKHLAAWQYKVEVVQDFQDVRGAFIKSEADLVLMDIGLPFFNGYHWCSEIRKISTVPIVFISSADDNMNIVMAMQMGGDDFIAKPFDLGVLVAKVQAIIRRSYAFQGAAHLLSHGGAVLNLSECTLSHGDDKLELTKNELKILQVLLERHSEVVSRSDLMNHLWESDSFIDDNTLTVNVARLRKKLEDIGLSGFIVTKKGIGYTIP